MQKQLKKQPSKKWFSAIPIALSYLAKFTWMWKRIPLVHRHKNFP